MLAAIPHENLVRSYPPGTAKTKSWPSARWTRKIKVAGAPSTKNMYRSVNVVVLRQPLDESGQSTVC